MPLGDRLKELRKLKAVSQSTVASVLGIGVTTYATWEQNKSEPNIDMINKLTDFFGTSADYLLGKNIPDIDRTDFIYRQIENLNENDKRTLIKIITALADDTKEQAQ